MKNKIFKKAALWLNALVAGALVVPGIVTICTDINGGLSSYIEARAEDVSSSKVYFESVSKETNTSNLIRVNLMVDGVAGKTINVTYSTKSGTAIEGIDYQGANNTISFKFDRNETQKHEIAIKILNDSSSRELMRVKNKEDGTIYGRYFSLNIDKAVYDNDNPVTIDSSKRTCRCYLPYSNEATASVGIPDTSAVTSREIAYLNEYETTLYATNSGFSKKAYDTTWKTWDKSFYIGNADKRKEWVNKYVSSGIANAYGTLLVEDIDDWDEQDYHSDTDMHVLFGNWDMTKGYKRSADCPGLISYFVVNTDKSGGYQLDGRAMDYIANGVDPNDKEKKLVNVSKIIYSSSSHELIYFRLPTSGWFGKTNSIYSAGFYKVDPSSSGEINLAAAFYNDGGDVKYWKQAKNQAMFLTLDDVTAPEVTNQWVEYNAETNKIRIYIRFNEPVYSSKKKNLSEIRIGGISQTFEANYVTGNYSDTLVYEMSYTPSRRITSMTYQLPSEDIGDLAYKLNVYGNVLNNLVGNTDQNRSLTIIGGGIDLTEPSIDADITGSNTPRNVYNVMINADAKGTGFTNGTAYYLWDNNETIANPGDPASYSNGNTRILTEDDQGSFPVTLANKDAGSYYLHVLVVSRYGAKAYKTFDKYILDGRKPEIIQLQPDNNTLKTKTFKLQTTNKTNPATSVKNVTLYTKYNKDNKVVTDSLPLIVNQEEVSSLASLITVDDTSVSGKTIYSFKTNIENENDYFKGLMDGQQHFECDVYFSLEDVAGNKATSNSIRAIYDERTSFTVDVTIPSSYSKIPGIGDITKDIFNIAGASGSEGIKIEIPSGDTINRGYIDSGATFSVIVNGEEITANESDKYSVTLSNAKAGLYSVLARISGQVGGASIDIISGKFTISGETKDLDSYNYYLTNGNGDATPNKARAEGNLVLSNQVYQVQDVRYVFYDDNNKTISNHLYGATYNSSSRRYEGGSAYPTFSSVSEAKKYFTFMEKQDLRLEKITDNIAQYLNSGSGSIIYVKAPGETTYAQGGQLWIRYKRNTWRDSDDTSNWVYYYYGEGSVENGINYNDLSLTLNDAIEEVVKTICKSGKTIYLVNEENINQNTGAPYLTTSQMHVDREAVSQAKNGTVYVSDLVYEGDSKLYQNTAKYEDGNYYPIATNMPLIINSSTTLYLNNEGDNWEFINAVDGMTLRDVLPSTKVTKIYKIREYSDEGIGEFTVIFDNSLPILRAYKDGDSVLMELDGTDPNITCRTLVLDSMKVTKIDPYTYVAVYSYPYKNLITVLYQDNIQGYTLTNGNYYLQIGDRSGNIINYRVLTSDTNIDLKVSENDSKTAVIVKVNNRSSSEIYSYEVYLNEELIDSEFADTKIYREPGVYRVVVRDIYGNIQTTTLSHDSPTPEMTWYYINSSGSTSKYDPSRIDRMRVVPDSENSRLTNVYASTLVSVVISNAYESGGVGYELTGLESGEYTFNETTGLLSIKVLKGWRLRVWYTNNPEVDMLYVFQLDSEAPSYAGTFIGNSFTPNSNISDIDLTDKEVGDMISYENLTYTKNESLSQNIENNDVICGSHISFVISDPSGIKDKGISVTRNGNAVEHSFNYETGVLDLVGYGLFVILATDALGNTSRFEFTNVSSLATEGYIDEALIKENSEDNYGHNNLLVNTLFEGETTILVKNESNSYSYVFNYDGTTIEYGYYQVGQEIVDDVTRKIATYHNVGAIIDRSDDRYRSGVWYEAVRDVYFIVSIMVNADGEACYKVECTSSEIAIETLSIINGGKIANRYKAILAKATSGVSLYTGSDLIENTNVDMIYIADDLTIGNDVDSKITKIEVAFNNKPEFDNYVVIYENGAFITDFVGKDDGFYQIVVTNIYNNARVYNISKIDTFNSMVKIYVMDGSEVVFTVYPENEPLCSNFAIDLIIYSDTVTFDVNGVVTAGYYENGATILNLKRQGDYAVRVVGANGVFQNFLFEIKNDDTFLYQESWITGYNKEALLADEYYTNTRCDINLGDRVVFIDMDVYPVNGDKMYVKLYDDITDNPQTDIKYLLAAIGAYGDGDYSVGFRNKYGDLIKHTVHYCATPALQLSRKTTYSYEVFEPYQLGLALEKGFQSNYVLQFATTSSNYIFTINGESYRLDNPRVLEFTNISGNGYFSYKVTYKDEYGNDIAFDAILNREDVSLDSSKMKTVILGGELYTKDDVVITFADNLSATVSIDEGASTSYTSGKAFYKDGKYRFVVEDIAGNQNIYTINHKSVNHYRLYKQNSDENIISGGAMNNAVVTFAPSDDSHIKYVFRNGELQEGYSSVSFSSTGHWELLIEDSIGNQSYEDFYIINNELSKFDYTSPYDYEITEVWKVNSDCTRELTTIKGKNISLTSRGNYLVVVTSSKTASSFNFTVGINNDAPKATLVGAEDGGVTARDVSLTNLSSGDIIKIYKNNELISTTTIGSGSEAPKITSSGNYKVVVTNIQGVSIEYNFIRRPIASISASVFIIITCALAIVGMGVGLIYHTKLKADD